MKKNFKTVFVSLILLFSLVLTSCRAGVTRNTDKSDSALTNTTDGSENVKADTGNINPNPATITNYESIKREYQESIEKLNWPDSFTLPEELNLDQDIQYQSGYGDTIASNLWQYAWEKEWLDTYQTDEERANKAIEELEKAFDMDYLSPQRADDATRRFLRDYIDRAKLGDPSGFQQDILANNPYD